VLNKLSCGPRKSKSLVAQQGIVPAIASHRPPPSPRKTPTHFFIILLVLTYHCHLVGQMGRVVTRVCTVYVFSWGGVSRAGSPSEGQSCNFVCLRFYSSRCPFRATCVVPQGRAGLVAVSFHRNSKIIRPLLLCVLLASRYSYQYMDKHAEAAAKREQKSAPSSSVDMKVHSC
jgi:hypothetical protein